jgi:hypothetical protein
MGSHRRRLLDLPAVRAVMSVLWRWLDIPAVRFVALVAAIVLPWLLIVGLVVALIAIARAILA